MIGTHGISRAAKPYAAKGIIAEHCIECHRVPGFAEEGRNPEINAPNFQVMVDDRKTYTSARLTEFLRRPHFPMREFIPSESDIQKLTGFIESLRDKPENLQIAR